MIGLVRIPECCEARDSGGEDFAQILDAFGGDDFGAFGEVEDLDGDGAIVVSLADAE